MKKYKFKVSSTNYLEFTEEKYNKLPPTKVIDTNNEIKNVKEIAIKRDDEKYFIILAPLDMFEVENDD